MSSVNSILSRLVDILSGRYHSMLDGKIRKIQAAYCALDRDIEIFKKKTKLSCIEGCGHCCACSTVEASEAEMLPLADALIRRGEAEAWYVKAQAAGFTGRCVFSEPQPGNEHQGRCACYTMRPFICRFFGFSANVDKRGGMRFVACKFLKERDTDEIEKIQDDVVSGAVHAPSMSEYLMAAASLDPSIGVDMMPINQAFQKAVEHISLHRRCSHVRFGK
jgi:uncharacterized protein